MRTTPLIVLTLAGCLWGKGDDSDTAGPTELGWTEIDGVYLPDPDTVKWADGVDNPYMPCPSGATWTYEAGDADIEVQVTAQEVEINGVSVVVVRDTETEDAVLVEDTLDWYAQDTLGNVWYLGEDVCIYDEDVVCSSKAGSWAWGEDGALPGLLMPATPEVDGRVYYQEYSPGVAEDMGEVIAVGQSASTAVGDFDDCIQVRETSGLEPGDMELKTWCAGVGLVYTDEGAEEEVLTATSGL